MKLLVFSCVFTSLSTYSDASWTPQVHPSTTNDQTECVCVDSGP